jgi:hypothetical protein
MQQKKQTKKVREQFLPHEEGDFKGGKIAVRVEDCTKLSFLLN